MATVMNPGIPYVGGIPGGMRDGRQIVINGTVPHHEHSFSINLQTGPNINPRSNTALHFNPRLNDNCVVRNSYQHHSWGGEERGGYQPFQRGMPFEITILCQHHHYKVVNNVNLGEHLNNFSAQTSYANTELNGSRCCRY
uniref:Galectin n=1 Tax=Magallana gigas TaxID=29159 RepID=A0A8W8I555_MAGGI